MRQVLRVIFVVLAASGCATAQVVETTSIDLTHINVASEATTQPTQSADRQDRSELGAAVCDGLEHELRVVDTQAHLIHRFDVDNPDSWKAEMTEFGLLQPSFFNESLDRLRTVASGLDDSYSIAIETYRTSMVLVEEGHWADLEPLATSPTYLGLISTIDAGLTDSGC